MRDNNMKIEIANSKKCSGEYSCFVTFSFNWDIVNKIKDLPIRYFSPETKAWELPLNSLDQLQKTFPTAFLINKEKIKLTKNKVIPKHTRDLKNFKFKTDPFAHQKDAFNFGLVKNKWLLGDEMGLGKSKVAIDIASALKESIGLKHTLVICCVNSIKYNWYNEIKLHSNNSAIVIDGSNTERAETLANVPKEYFYIINIEALRNKEVLSVLVELITENIIEYIIVDEIHKAKNPSSLQGKGLLKLNSNYKLALTGTPLMNSPEDAFIILKWLDIESHNFYQFKHFYCIMGGYGNYQVVGYKNLHRLSNMLDNNMLRRLKIDELDLPPKIKQIDYVEMPVKQRKIYNEVLAGIKENIDKIKLSPNPLALLIRLRQVTSAPQIISTLIKDSAKIDRLKEILEEVSGSGQKAIIYSNWTSVTDILREELKSYNPAVITGQIKDRQAQVEKFQTDKSCEIMIGTIGACGTGLNLTSASYVIFMDKPWNPANTEQAEDRAHRIGTKGSVNIITLACKDSIDERIEEILEGKENIIDAVVNNKQSKINILQQLLGSQI